MTLPDYDAWIERVTKESRDRGIDWGILSMLVIIANILLKIYRKMN